MDWKHHCCMCVCFCWQLRYSGLWIHYPASPPHNRQEDNWCHGCWFSSDSLSFQIRQLMLNAHPFSGTQSEVHQWMFPQRYSAKRKLHYLLFLVCGHLKSIHVWWHWGSVGFQKGTVLFLFLFHTVFTDNVLTSLASNASNDNVSQICLCLHLWFTIQNE